MRGTTGSPDPVDNGDACGGQRLMWRLAGRNAVVSGAVLAAVLLTMQLQTEGTRGYELSDLLSILLFAVPVVVRHARPIVVHPRRHEAAGDSAPTALSDAGPPIAARAMAAQRARGVEPLIVRAIAVLIAGGAYAVALVLVVAQAWVPALSALIACGIALAGASGGPDPTASRRA